MKEQKEHLGKGKRMSEKEQEMTSKKLGIHVGDSFQDTREIREVLDKSVFREEEPMHGSRAEVLEEPVTTANLSRGISTSIFFKLWARAP